MELLSAGCDMHGNLWRRPRLERTSPSPLRVRRHQIPDQLRNVRVSPDAGYSTAVAMEGIEEEVSSDTTADVEMEAVEPRPEGAGEPLLPEQVADDPPRAAPTEDVPMHEGASPGALPVEGGASPGAIPGEGGAIPGAEPLVVAPGAEAPAASSKSMPAMPRQPAPTTAKRVRDALSKGGLRNLESTRVFHHDCMITALDCLNSALNPGHAAESF